jgi:hypothetical protein
MRLEESSFAASALCGFGVDGRCCETNARGHLFLPSSLGGGRNIFVTGFPAFVASASLCCVNGILLLLLLFILPLAENFNIWLMVRRRKRRPSSYSTNVCGSVVNTLRNCAFKCSRR